MITENGAIKVETALNEKMQKELTRSAYIMSLAFIIVGALGVAAFLTLEIVTIFLEWEDENLFFIMMVLFAVLLGSGISLTVIMNKNLAALKGLNRLNVYEFYRNYFLLTEVSNGETVGSAKIYNDRIIKTRETQNYLFLYITAGAAYPVEKAGLTEAELNTLKSILRAGYNGGGTVPLTEEPNAEAKPGTPDVQEPQDPFDELK